MKVSYIEENFESSQFTCKECTKNFNGILNYVMHISRTHGTEAYYIKWEKGDNEGKCKECGAPTKFISITKGYTNFCCVKHRFIFSHKKQKENNKNNYGVEYTFQRKDVIDKIKKTNIRNHNGHFSSSTPEVIKKSKETRKEKYGNENTLI